MFTFGILSSHLPYVAFIAFYIFYLFFPSLLDKHDNETIDTSEEKILFVAPAHQAEQTGESAVDYFQHLSASQQQGKNISPQYQLLLKIPILSNNQKPEIRFYSSVFSRPPPVL